MLRTMNLNLQKLEQIHRKKAESAEALVQRCMSLEETNKKLVQCISDMNVLGVSRGPETSYSPIKDSSTD